MIRLGDRWTLAALGVLTVAAGTNPALAADLPVYKAAPAAIAPLSWTGFFVGSHVGWGEGQKKFIDNFPTPDGEVDADVRNRGWIGGLQGGYNQQFNWLVLGVEGDFTWSGVRNTNFSCFAFGNQVCSADAEWFSTLAGRAGVAFGPALLYATGGIAWARDTFTDLATCLGSQPQRRGGIPALCGDQFIGSEIRAGWMVGFGLEYLFAPRWSVKVEYDYLDFGQRSTVLVDGLGNAFTEEIHQNVQLVKVGLNYKFGWGDMAPLWAYGYQGGPPYSPSKSAGEDEPPSHVLAFTGADVSKRSFDGWLGTLIAPWQDLDKSGPRVWLSGGAGIYNYSAEGTIFRGTTSTGEILTGYAFEGDNYSTNLLVGLNAINHMVAPFDPLNSVQGTAGGVKVRADSLWNPTTQTLVYGEGEYSTAFRTYYVSGKVGWDVTNGKEIFVGPQVTFLGDERFDQWRVGAHATQLTIGKVQIDVGAGFMHDSIVGDGAYGRVELSTNF